MKLLFYISDMTIPLVFVIILVHGYLRRVDIYDVFIDGTMDGLKTVVKILPTLIGLMVAVGILRASGSLDFLSTAIAPITRRIGFPSEAVPLSLMRLISSSASVGLILDIFKNYGPDSFLGRLVSIMMGCTETVFYTMSVYFMSVGIKKTRYTLPIAIIINIAGGFVALIITLYVFGR